MRDYYEKLYANKLDNLEEMAKFLETYNMPRLNHEGIEKSNRPIMSKESEIAIKTLTKEKAQDKMVSLVNSTKHLQKN